MEQEEKWNQFTATGRVQDYLSYRQKDAAGGTVFNKSSDVMTGKSYQEEAGQKKDREDRVKG